MRIWNNLKWLFNHPPIAITTDAPEDARCDYCGRKSPIWNHTGIYCICAYCRKKVFDFALKEKNENSSKI